MLNQVNLETLTCGPTGGRSVYGCRTAGGGNIILQDNVGIRVHNLWETNYRRRAKSADRGKLYPGSAKWKNTNHIDQGDCEASGVTGNGAPRDGLRALAGVPKGTLDGARNGDAQGGDDEQQSCRENREGAHCFSQKRQERRESKERRGENEGKFCL